MVHAKLSVLRDRTIATAGATVLMLSLPLVAPLVSAVANSQTQLPALSYANQRQIAVVDPVTGLLIHPLSGVGIDLADVVYDPGVGQYVDRVTGAIIPTDGSIPGLPLFAPGDPGSGIDEGAAGEAAPPSSAVTAVPQQPSLPSGSHQPGQAVPDAGSLVVPPPSNLPRSSPIVTTGGNITDFSLPSPAAVIASVVDLVLGSSGSVEGDAAAPAPPVLPFDEATSASSHTASGGITPNEDEAGLAAPDVDAAAPALTIGQSADVGQLPDTLTLKHRATQAGQSMNPQTAIPSRLLAPQVADDPVTVAPPPPLINSGLRAAPGLSHVGDSAPSWLLATAGSFLIIGGAGISYRLRRRGPPA
ncbi:MAG: hypothetical protein ACRD0K_23140 [Egibacteraceae bacterium]